jgi:urea carboxylase
LRFFDQIRFYEVSEDELATIRKDFPQGRYPIKIEESQFSLTEYQDFIATHQADIETFRRHRQQAFETELAQWHADGQFNFEVNQQTEEQAEASWPEESLVIDSPISGSVWQTEVAVGQQVKAGDCLMILESTKMEIPVYASADSRVTHVLLENGQRVGAGQALVVLQEG